MGLFFVLLAMHNDGHFFFPLQVTPAGYAQMTHMLSTLSGGKLLVVLEGGFVVYSLLFDTVQIII